MRLPARARAPRDALPLSRGDADEALKLAGGGVRGGVRRRAARARSFAAHHARSLGAVALATALLAAWCARSLLCRQRSPTCVLTPPAAQVPARVGL
jgi:hypothetical protein